MLRSFLLLLYISAGALCPFFASSSPPKARIDLIKERGHVIASVLATDTRPFIITQNDGRLTGLDIELAQALAKALNVQLKIDRSATTFDEIVSNVAEGKADIGLSGVSITTQRAEKVSYTHPYVNLRKAFLINRESFVKKRKEDEESLQAFFNHPSTIIGVMKSSAYEFYAKTMFPHAKLVCYSNKEIDTKAMQDLEAEKIDAVFRDEFQVQKLIKTKYHGVLKYMAVSLKNSWDPIGIVVQREAPHLLNWANVFLEVENISYTVDDLMKIYDEQEILQKS